MSAARRIEILVDRPLLRRVTAAADAAGVTNYALLPTLGGRSGTVTWRRDDLTGATDRILFTTIVSADKADALVAALTPLLDSHDLLLTSTIVDVVRGGKF
ncbi:MAG: P-II family nitrogen regulator [Polymorphobacter sp.]